MGIIRKSGCFENGYAIVWNFPCHDLLTFFQDVHVAVRLRIWFLHDGTDCLESRNFFNQ